MWSRPQAGLAGRISSFSRLTKFIFIISGYEKTIHHHRIDVDPAGRSAARAKRRESGLRRDLQDQRRGIQSLAGHADDELPHRRLRPPPDQLAADQTSCRMGAEEADGMGTRQCEE